MATLAAFSYIPQQTTLSYNTSLPARKPQRILHSFQTPKSKGGHKAVHPNEPVFLPILSTIVSQQPLYDMHSQTTVWADGPHKLIPTPTRRQVTGAVYCAREMANVHNMIIRGLNSILRQAPYIADASSPAYNPQDVSDLLFYTKAWCNALYHHHNTEENIFFPLVEKVTGVTGLMDDLEVEHEEFHDGLVALKLYVEKVLQNPDCYRWATMRTMIHAFSTALVSHLHSEIYFLLGLEMFGNEGLKKAWLETDRIANKVEDTTTLTEVFPLVLGCSDSTYEGGNNFPDVPKSLRRLIKHGFSKKRRGAWRFNPCDLNGRPQPLQMLPENRV